VRTPGFASATYPCYDAGRVATFLITGVAGLVGPNVARHPGRPFPYTLMASKLYEPRGLRDALDEAVARNRGGGARAQSVRPRQSQRSELDS
jgi:hypothetical protein